MNSSKKFWKIGACVAVLVMAGSIFFGCSKQESPKQTRPALPPRPDAGLVQCKINLRAIAAAKQQWMTEHHKSTNDVPTMDDLVIYMSREGDRIPACPSQGSYTIGRVGEPPRCSLPGHTLP